MSEAASPQKRNVEEVSAPEIVDDSKRQKADEPEVQESVLAETAPEAGSSTGEKEVNEDEIDEDELAALDVQNIIPGGRRTRGKEIDFKKAAEEAGPEEDDDEDDDADVTANTTIPKTDDGSSDEEDEDEKVEVEGEDASKA